MVLLNRMHVALKRWKIRRIYNNNEYRNAIGLAKEEIESDDSALPSSDG